MGNTMKALVVGNANYSPYNPLKNPRQDATKVHETFLELGFESMLRHDLTQKGFQDALKEFRDKIKDGVKVAVFFYAGHGAQIQDENYLIPTDAHDFSDWQSLRDGSLGLDNILQDIKDKAETAIIILDACRNNPFARSLGSESSPYIRGLAFVKPEGGTFIAFSTQPGNVAADGAGDNSPFTGALVTCIVTPHRTISEALMVVRAKVFQDTKGAQIPWEQSDLFHPFTFVSPDDADSTEKMTERERETDKNRLESEYFGYCVQSRSLVLINSFMKQYPKSTYTVQVEKLTKELRLEKWFFYGRMATYALTIILMAFSLFVFTRASGFYTQTSADFASDDYKVEHFSLPVLQVQRCKISCALDSRCKAYAFDAETGNCYFKDKFTHIDLNNSRTRTGAPRIYLGVKGGGKLVDDVKNIHSDIAEKYQIDFFHQEQFEYAQPLFDTPIFYTDYASCASFCEKLDLCKGFVFSSRWDKNRSDTECRLYKVLGGSLVSCSGSGVDLTRESCLSKKISGRKNAPSHEARTRPDDTRPDVSMH